MIDFEQALSALARARVRFVIMGGLAVTIRASSYVAFDLDFCHARDRQNLLRLLLWRSRVLAASLPRLRLRFLPLHRPRVSKGARQEFKVGREGAHQRLVREIGGRPEAEH